MSLLPMVLPNWCEYLDRPHRLFDQNFGLVLEDEDLPFYKPETEMVVLRPRRNRSRYQPYQKNSILKSSGSSTVQADKDKFQVILDVQQFLPDEVKVKVVDDSVVIEAKHEEKQDEHGWISRQFVRKYSVPEQCDIDQIATTLSSDGVLTVTAPRKEPLDQDKKERVIKIQHTGKPAIREDVTVKSSNSQKEKEAQNQKNAEQQRVQQEKTVKAA